MPISTERNHALKNISDKDISYLRLSHYTSELYEDPRLNLSIRFMPDSPYQELTNCKGYLNLRFDPTQNFRVMTNSKKAPDWIGYPEIRAWANSEKDQPDMICVRVGKGKFVGRPGSNKTPEEAYYTALGVSYQAWGKNKELCPWAVIRIGNFETELEMKPTERGSETAKKFSFIGEENLYYD